MAKTAQHGLMSLKLITLALIFSFLFSCTGKPGKSSADVTPPAAKVPDFNGDSAFAFVKKQVDFGPRVPGSKAHTLCGDYFVEKLKGYGLEVIEQKAPATTYDGKKYTLRNIIASYKPALGNRVLLVAHWDTRPFASKDSVNKDKPSDGANDGASGAGVLLEVARLLSVNHPEIGVDIFLNDLEDYGQENSSNEESWCLGTQHWAKNPHKPGYNASYGILLDMVGGKDPVFPKEANSQKYAPNIVERVWNTAAGLGYSASFVNVPVGSIIDDHYYINEFAKIPTIDIIPVNPATGEFPFFHHRHSDNLSNVDVNTLKMVGQVIITVIYRP